MAGEQKKDFIRELTRDSQQLRAVIDRITDQIGEYFDAAYNGGAGDAIIQADLDIHDMTVAEFTNYITLIQQLENFANNVAVVTGDYGATLNNMKRAPV